MVGKFRESALQFDEIVSADIADPEVFFRTSELFGDIVKSRIYQEQLNSILQSVLNRDVLTNAELTTGTFVTLHTSDTSSWIIMEHKRRSQFLYMAPVHALQSPIFGPGYSVDRYRMTHQFGSMEIDKDTSLEYLGRDHVPCESVFKKSARGEVVDVILDDQSNERNFSLRVSSQALAPFQVNFDRQTKRTFGLTPVDIMASNLTTIFDLLTDIGDPRSIEHLAPFVEHNLHFVRWRAMRAIFGIDEVEGLRLLEQACNDEHAQVRQAAESTLERLAN